MSCHVGMSVVSKNTSEPLAGMCTPTVLFRRRADDRHVHDFRQQNMQLFFRREGHNEMTTRISRLLKLQMLDKTKG